MKKQKGFALAETMVTLAVVGASIATTGAMYQGAQKTSKIETMLYHLAEIESNLATKYFGIHNYSYLGLTNATAVSENIVPSAMVKAGGIYTVFDTPMSLASIAAHNDATYSITYSGLPEWACIDFARAVAKRERGTFINSSPIKTPGVTTNLALIPAACSSVSNTIILYNG